MWKLYKNTIIMIICIIIIYFLLLSVTLNPKKSISSIYIPFITCFNDYEILKEEVNNNKIESVEKDNSIYKIVYKDQENLNATYNELNKQLKNMINTMKKFKIESIERDRNNLIFIYNSKINFAQSIVYITDRNEFVFNHIVTKEVQLKDKWYYIEEK